MKIPIEISARHAHLSSKDLIKLFGRGYSLKKIKKLSQIGEFAAQETVELHGPHGILENVRVVGPVRKDTQVEISMTDARFLGINAPVRLSGDIKKTPGIKIKGPRGTITLREGVIIPQRHLHINKKQADKLKIKTDDLVSVKVKGERGLIFNKIIVRVHPSYHLSLHVDTDEANAAGIKKGIKGDMI